MSRPALRFAARHAVAAALVLLTGCSPRLEGTALERASGLLQKGDLAAAEIEFKNALQADPNSKDARLLLGRTLHDREDFVPAIVELQKAQDLGVAAEQVAPLLARSLLGAGELRKLVEAYGSTDWPDKPTDAEVKATVASGLLLLGRKPEAEQLVRKALQVHPEGVAARIVQARLLASQPDLEGALAAVGEVLSGFPAHADALVLKGDLLLAGRNDPKAAAAEYSKALESRPASARAHVQLISTSLQQRDLASATAQLAAMRKARPRDIRVAYFEARIAFDKGDVPRAREIAEQLLKLSPEAPDLHQLTGLIALQQGRLPQAEQHFKKVLQLVEGAGPARRLLATAQMRRGDFQGVLATLTPALDVARADAESLVLAGVAHLRLGDVRRGQDLLAKAYDAPDATPATRASIALQRLTHAVDAPSLAELERLVAEDPGTTARIVLVDVALRKGEFETATQAVDELQVLLKGRPDPLMLKGQVQLRQGRVEAARESFAAALSIKPDFYAAVRSLVDLEVRAGRFDAARSVIDLALKASPKNVQLHLDRVSVDEIEGKTAEAVEAGLRKAMEADPSAAAPRVRLVGIQLARKEAKRALALAQDASAALPDDPAVLDVLAQAQAAAGELNQAVATYGKLALQLGNDPRPLMSLALLQARHGNGDAAVVAARKAIELRPRDLRLWTTLVDLVREAQGDRAAMEHVRAAQKEHPSDALGWLLACRLEGAAKRWTEALKACEVALQREPGSPEAASLRYEVLRQAGRREQADGWAGQWLARHPEDVAFRNAVATGLLLEGDFARSLPHLTTLTQLRPDDPYVLNNLAWAMHQLKQPGAWPFAERALRLAPRVPGILDTAAAILADSDVKAALAHQADAVRYAPGAVSYRYRLVSLYAQAGDRERARSELKKLEDPALRADPGRLKTLGALIDG